MSEREFTFDETKAAELIALIASRVEIGKTKLMKLLYLIDFTAYSELGRPVTGDKYEHWPFGPVPSTVFSTLDKLTSIGHLTVTLTEIDEKRYVEYRPTRSPSGRSFTADEMGIINDVLNRYGKMSSHELVDLTHAEIPYLATQAFESIPYCFAPFRQYQKVTPEDVEQLRSNQEYLNRIRKSFATNEAN